MRSRDSRYYDKRFMMRLDPKTWEKLKELSMYFDKSAAEIIRQLIAQAKPADFPQACIVVYLVTTNFFPQEGIVLGIGSSYAGALFHPL